MKGKKRLCKKALSLFLTVVMLMTCWVFVAPEKAAAGQTSYKWKVQLKVRDSYDWKHNAMNVYVDYYTNNGYGSNYQNNGNSYFSVSKNQYENDNADYTFEGTSAGFPTRVRLSAMKNNNSIWNANYQCILWVYNYNSSSWVQLLDTGKVTGIGAGKYLKNADVSNCSSTNSAWPKINKITGLTGTTLTIPKASGTVTSGSLSSVGEDQYGVNWYQNPTYTIANKSGTNVSNPSLATTNNTVKITATTGCFTTANGYTTASGQTTFTLKSTIGSVSATSTITVKSDTYYVYFYDGNDLLNPFATKSCYYNGSVTAPTSADKNPDANYHYQFKAWDKGYTGIKSDTSINATFNAIAHTFQYANNNDGTHKVTCSGCSYTTAEAHDYAVTTVNAQCEVDGSKNFKCTKCGDSYSETLTATGHNFTGAAKSHLNGKDGDHYYKCVNTNCNEYGVGTTKNATEPHTWDAGVVTKDSTCDVLGIKTYTCTVCGATYTEDIPVKGHTLQKVDYKAPTCTATGN
ncbi:MAG: hypothetical protein MR567_10300, partial [Oscillospiraceae bacterium]|nr:hypothetical protein [Oscillospiraceae bacterium]